MTMSNLAGVGQALDVSLPTIITDFNLLRDVTGVFRNSADPQTLKKHSGVSWLRNNYGRAVAYNLDEVADMNQAQTLTDFQTVITPAEVGAQVVLPGSTLRRIQDAALESRVAQMLNNAYNLKEDIDGANQMGSWTGSVGSTSTIIGVGHIAAGAAQIGVGRLVANPEPAPLPYTYVGHDFQLLHLMGRTLVFTDVPTGTTVYSGVAAGQTIGAGGAGAVDSGGISPLLLNGIVGEGGKVGMLTQFMGVSVKKDANIPVTSTPSASGGLFSQTGFLYVSELEPRVVMQTDDVSMREAVELNVWGAYGYGLYRPVSYGVTMTFDATTPTD